MEAAGQLVHLFRDGLDYAFILDIHADVQERSVLFGLGDSTLLAKRQAHQHRILVSTPPLPDQPTYESLRGKGSWPSITPRRCRVGRCRPR